MATPRDAKFPADPADGMARSDPTNEYPNGCIKSQYFSRQRIAASPLAEAACAL
jgi:hypothetical protein